MAKFIQYGGALFSAKCPKCGRIAKPWKSMSVNRFMSDFTSKKEQTAPADCKKCGYVRIKFICFEKDVA